MSGSRSLLLDLPTELRLLVWEHLYADSLIHVFHDSESTRWISVQCTQPESFLKLRNDDSLPLCPALAVVSELWDPVRPRHEACQDAVDRQTRVRMGPMLACRQFHAEIEPILYSRNTFQIESGISFALFVDGRTEQQRAWLRHLRLDMNFFTSRSTSTTEWLAALGLTRMTRLIRPQLRLEITGIWKILGRQENDVIAMLCVWRMMGLLEPHFAVRITLPEGVIDDTYSYFTKGTTLEQSIEALSGSWRLFDLRPTHRAATGRIMRAMKNVALSGMPENREAYHNGQFLSKEQLGELVEKHRLHKADGAVTPPGEP